MTGTKVIVATILAMLLLLSLAVIVKKVYHDCSSKKKKAVLSNVTPPPYPPPRHPPGAPRPHHRRHRRHRRHHRRHHDDCSNASSQQQQQQQQQREPVPELKPEDPILETRDDKDIHQGAPFDSEGGNVADEQRDKDAAEAAEKETVCSPQREERSKSDVVKEVEATLKQKESDEEAKKRALALMRPLTDAEAAIVKKALYEIGLEADIVAQEGPDSIQRVSIQRLRPGTWLNDEVVHFFYVMLSKRDADLCQSDPARKRSHFFKSFFMTRLLNEGHKHPNINGTYEYNNVKRWSKKVPGKYKKQ